MRLCLQCRNAVCLFYYVNEKAAERRELHAQLVAFSAAGFRKELAELFAGFSDGCDNRVLIVQLLCNEELEYECLSVEIAA